MRFSYTLFVLNLSCLARADASFRSVQTRLQKDMSGKDHDSGEKYFHTSKFHPYYDGRFADRELTYIQRTRDVANLVGTYLATFSDLGVETWLMHDTLLGWWWNQKVLPWDFNVDVQVSEASMTFLAHYYNMSTYHYRTPRIPEGRDYLLEINPHYPNGDIDDIVNAVDARWIDTRSGVFIDISAVRKHEEKDMIYCKGGRKYKENEIYPLRPTVFEGIPAKVPFAYIDLLKKEHGKAALNEKSFENHVFSDEKMEWLLLRDEDPVAGEAEL